MWQQQQLQCCLFCSKVLLLQHYISYIEVYNAPQRHYQQSGHEAAEEPRAALLVPDPLHRR